MAESVVGIRITAKDDTSTAIRSVNTSLGEMVRSAGSVNGALSGLIGKIGPMAGALGAALAVGQIVQFSRATIDAADAMNDMSQRIGVSVADLAKYQLAANQSGTSMEAIAKGVKGLAANMAEHGEALKKAGITAWKKPRWPPSYLAKPGWTLSPCSTLAPKAWLMRLKSLQNLPPKCKRWPRCLMPSMTAWPN